MHPTIDQNEANEINGRLATACQATCSSCCKKGKIFLPDGEHQKILDWIKEHAPADLEEFESRCEKHNGFHLYDQQNACQFLNASDLCRLHNQGVKPRECFWWPLHVYTTETETLDIRVSTSCCDAYKNISADSAYVDAVESEVEQLGAALIRDFRSVYPGSYSGVSLRKIDIAAEP